MKKVQKEKLASVIETINNKFTDSGFIYTENNLLSEFSKLINNTKEKITLIEDNIVVSILGGTNSGKSTTINALFEQEISSISPEAPHDKTSIVVVHDETDFNHETIDFGPRLIKNHKIDNLKDTVIICGVDFDSVELTNQISSRKIFNSSDLVCFITTPEKYADNTFFTYLKEAFDLEKQILIVVNKSSLLEKDAIIEIKEDLTQKLSDISLPKKTVLENIQILFCDAKNAYENNENTGEFIKLKKILFEDIYRNKNLIKLKEINSDLKNLSLNINGLHKAGTKDEKKINELKEKLKELNNKYQIQIEDLFITLEIKFQNRLEKLVIDVSQANAYLRLTSFFKNIYSSIFSFTKSEKDDEELANSIFSLFFPEYSECHIELKNILSDEPVAFSKIDDLKSHFKKRIISELKIIESELKNNVSQDIGLAFGKIIKKDVSALVTTGVLVMLFSLNGLLLTEILASLFGGFFVSEAGRQKAVKLVTKIKSDAVENLRNRIEIIFFEEFIKVQDNIGEKISNMQPLMEAMTSKGEIEMLREQIGEIIAES